MKKSAESTLNPTTDDFTELLLCKVTASIITAAHILQTIKDTASGIAGGKMRFLNLHPSAVII